MMLGNFPMAHNNYFRIRKIERFICPILVSSVFLTTVWGCRLWAVLASEGYDLYNPDTVNLSCLYQELSLLQEQGGTYAPFLNDDGWGISYYFQSGNHSMVHSFRSSRACRKR